MKYLFYTQAGLRIILTALIYTLFPLVVITLLTAKANFIPGFNSFTVLTGSMEPLVPVGSIVYVVNSQSYSIGDIISFDVGKINVTHRIVDIVRKDNQLFYRTKGDANSSIDNELVPANKVTGEILFHFPYLGKFISFLRSVPGFLMFIVFPTLVFVGFELWNIKKEIEKETEKKVLKKLRSELHFFAS
jgi:signal peptidase I